MHQRGDYRDGEHRLGYHHSGGRKEQIEKAKWHRMREREVQYQPDNHRGQSEKGIDENDDRSSSNNRINRKGSPQGQADDGGSKRCRHAHAHRKRDYLRKFVHKYPADGP